MADQDEQGNTNFKKKCRVRLKKCWDSLIKISAWPLFAKIAVWVILALIVFFLVTTGLSGDGVLRFMKYLGRGAEPIRITTTALTMIGGIGAVGYLVIKYQERTAAQRAEQREQRGEQRAIARQQADELLDAIHLLGDDKASTRVAGVQSLIQIGQDRQEIRQRIIDILCGYLRTDRDKDGAVESTILATLKEHLTPRDSDPDLLWENIDIDLRNSTITEPINLSGIVCRKFDMSEAHVESATPADFTEALFTQTASFNNVTCSRGMNFKKAHFGKCLGDDPSEYGALFSYTTLVEFDFSEATLNHANFTASNIDTCLFIDSDFPHPDFTGCRITETQFHSAHLQNASFQSCKFNEVSFYGSTFLGKADFTRCIVEAQLDFRTATFGGTKAKERAEVIFDEALIFGSIDTMLATSYDSWSFYGAHFLKSDKDMGESEFQTELFRGMDNKARRINNFYNIIFDLDKEDASNTIKNGN